MQRHRFLLIRSPPVKSDLKNPKVVGVGAELSSLKGDKTGARVQKLLQGYAGHVSGLLRQVGVKHGPRHPNPLVLRAVATVTVIPKPYPRP